MLIAAALVGIVVGSAAGVLVYLEGRPSDEAAAAVSTLKLDEIPFDGAQAYKYLKDLCAIGPRPERLARHGRSTEAADRPFSESRRRSRASAVSRRHPVNDSWVSMTNIIVRWNPKATERILLCAHYDTLPYPLMDPVDPQGKFVGANDNASGVAILMQLARDMPELKSKYGVDFLMLDGEEFIFSRDDRFFLGSEYFAREYAKKKPCYRWGVLLDMVGSTQAPHPSRSQRPDVEGHPPAGRPDLVDGGPAGRGEFVPRPMREVDFLDDHVMLHNVGRIPCIDVIDFDYPPWHTRGDTPDKCSPLSLAKVGWVIREWLKTAK